MLAFLAGAIPFYILPGRSRLVPRALSLRGLVALLPFVIGVPLKAFGTEPPFFLFVPDVPFELAIGLWLSFKGSKEA